MANPLTQIGDEVREMTDDEVAAYEALQQELHDVQAAQVAALEARKEPLRRLGLTEDEINTVLGL